MEAEDEAGLLAAEQEVQVEIDPTAAKRNERQVLLSEFGMRALTSAHILALHFLLGCFFLACRIPFNVVRNVFFREFIKGLCPACYPHLPTFETLRTTIVDNVYEETILSTNAILDNAPGKRTLILDGKTNAVGRATCNLCDGKPGLSAYITTKYFGKREHSGRVQASYVYEQLSGQEEKYRAVVADNTGSMQKKTTLSYKEYCTTVLSPEDAADVVLSFETELDSSDDDLPCGEAGTAQEPLEAEDDDIDVSLPAVVHRMAFQCPAGFSVAEKPSAFLTGATTFRAVFILMLWKAEGWQVGKIKKYAPERVRHNHDILWAEGVRGSKLSLDNYAISDSLELQPVGTWAYVRAM
ncbi:hypothetical protein CYMTET_4875 [Cymbomonas tetramitiformis]|uniref:Uncharacterized protein n=1 Tax=Cymbomonas tetramitiformis TaxID=36881 RepID=A0AAE0H264_9CHLO|nr:hypothetical protein CYMTET_4875 [Cymbomonas tetramitiformis]